MKKIAWPFLFLASIILGWNAAAQAGFGPAQGVSGGGGSASLQTAYDSGATIAEAGGVPVALSSTTADNGNVLTVTKNPGSTHSGIGVNVTMGANTTGSGIFVACSGLGSAITGSNSGSGASGAVLAQVTGANSPGFFANMSSGTAGAALYMQGASGGISVFIESTDGSGSAVSGAATGRMRYNDSTGTWQVSTQGGAWASLGMAGVPTLASVLVSGNSTGAKNLLVSSPQIIQFYGTSSSFAGIRGSGATLQFVLADESNFAPAQTGGLSVGLGTLAPVNGTVKFATGNGALTQIVGPTDQRFKVAPGAGRDLLLQLTGTNSSAAGVRGNGVTVEAVLADESNYTGFQGAGITVGLNTVAPTTGKIVFSAGNGQCGLVGATDQPLTILAGAGQDMILNSNNYVKPLTNGSCGLGAPAVGFANLYLDYTNTATVGNVIINKASGTVNLAAVGSTMTVTNSKVTANSHVMVTLASDPGVALAVWTVCSAGSFTINTRPATVNQVAIDFAVIGAD